MAKDKYHQGLLDYCRRELGDEIEVRIADFGEVLYAMVEKDGMPFRVVQFNVWYEGLYQVFKLEYVD